MSNKLNEISFKLGEINGSLLAINKNLEETKEEITGVVKRVSTIENERSFESGIDTQNKKIAAFIGGIAGIVASHVSSLLAKLFE